MNITGGHSTALGEQLAALSLHESEGESDNKKCILNISLALRPQVILDNEPANKFGRPKHCPSRVSLTTPLATYLGESSRTALRKRAKRKRSFSQTIYFCHKFILNEPVNLFIQNWKPTLAAWTSLLRETIIPPNISVVTLDISMAAKALNGVIAGGGGTYLPPRFGHVQLVRFFATLEDRIEKDRRNGLIPLESSHGNSSVAIDMYLRGQGVGPVTMSTRGKIWECKRIGRRWRYLIGPSILLLAIYSNTAEAFMHVPSHLSTCPDANPLNRKDHSMTDNPTLEALAAVALGAIPGKLVNACVYLSLTVEIEMRSGLLYKDCRMNETEDHIREYLLSQ